MVSSFVVATAFFIAGRQGYAVPSHVSLLITIATTSVVWLATTYLTAPTSEATLVSFYERARPAGPGWRRSAAKASVGRSTDPLGAQLLACVFGCVAIYGTLFGTGALLYGRALQGGIVLTCALVGVVGLVRLMPRILGDDVGHDR